MDLDVITAAFVGKVKAKVSGKAKKGAGKFLVAVGVK